MFCLRVDFIPHAFVTDFSCPTGIVSSVAGQMDHNGIMNTKRGGSSLLPSSTAVKNRKVWETQDALVETRPGMNETIAPQTVYEEIRETPVTSNCVYTFVVHSQLTFGTNRSSWSALAVNGSSITLTKMASSSSIMPSVTAPSLHPIFNVPASFPPSTGPLRSRSDRYGKSGETYVCMQRKDEL